MAAKKSKKYSVKKITRAKTSDYMNDEMETTPVMAEMDTTTPKTTNSKFRLIAVAVIILAILAAVALRNKNWFVAAMVNGMPITRMELNDKTVARFGSQVLDGLIGERLIMSEAAKKNIAVTDADIKDRMDSIEQSFNGQMKLSDALKLQGVTEDEFKNQVRIQIMVDKLLGSEVSVSAQEVDEYVKANESVLTATDPAQRRADAEKDIKATKINTKFQEWFSQLKESAKVSKYL